MGQHTELALNRSCTGGDRKSGIERRAFCVLACIVLFSAALCRYWVSYAPSDSVPRGPEPFRLAHNIYDTGKFANPFGTLATGPTAHLSPVLPSFQALLMKVFGDGSTGIYAIKLAAALVLSLQLALYPVFSRILGMGEINGIIAASIWIVAKPRMVYSWEGIYPKSARKGGSGDVGAILWAQRGGWVGFRNQDGEARRAREAPCRSL